MSKSTAKPMSELVAQWLTFLETTKPTKGDNEMGRYAADSGGGDFTPAPAGTHVARCVKLIDIGTHHSVFEGKENARNQVIVMWELPNELIDIDGEQKPVLATKFFTNSLSEKANLRKDLQGWRGKAFTVEELLGFDLMNILGKACMLSIVHEPKTGGGTKAKVVSVSALPRGMPCPDQVNPSFHFWIDDWDQQKFDALSDGLKKLIMASDEYKAMKSPPSAVRQKASVNDEFESDIPF